MGKRPYRSCNSYTLVIIFFHRKIILKMQASLCFFLGIIVLVQIGNAYPKNKGASQAEEADSTKNARNLSDLKKETAKDINYLLDLFCPFLKLSDPSKNFSLDREAAKDYLKQNPGLGLLQTLTGPLCGVLFLANKTTSDAGLSRTKRAAKASTLPGIVSSDKKAVRDLINKVASDVSSLLSPKWAAKLSNLADKFRHDTLADTVAKQVALLLSLTEKADGKEKAAKLSNLVKIFSFDRKAARELVDKVVNEVSSLLRMRKLGPGQKNEAKTDMIRQKEAQIGSLIRQKECVTKCIQQCNHVCCKWDCAGDCAGDCPGEARKQHDEKEGKLGLAGH